MSNEHNKSYELIFKNDHLRHKWLNVKGSHKHLFLNINGTSIIFLTDIGSILTKLNTYKSRWTPWLGGGSLADWFKAHPELKVGDKVRFTVIEPMKNYRLEVVK